ncbi:hypothetical protein E2C01_088503 [Portunus trituberculatus]|uniref:Uncharacterized protein n=1 Tax=Portunus trituberculatus TaxID=210409 RepID=A0A5B7JJJ7_PORTR|nr:hypothetical protein [Portunus trituberculatus]
MISEESAPAWRAARYETLGSASSGRPRRGGTHAASATDMDTSSSSQRQMLHDGRPRIANENTIDSLNS